MSSITPIYERDGDKSYREFFQNDFGPQRLGKYGRWRGHGAAILELHDPAHLPTFQNLLRGQFLGSSNRLRSLAAHGENEQAWRFTFIAPPSVSVLWALTPKPVRDRIEDAHSNSVDWALKAFEADINNWDGRWWKSSEPWAGYPRATFVKFISGAACDQTPQLQTNVFFFNLAFHRDGSVGTFAHDRVLKQERSLEIGYDLELSDALWRAIGSFREGPGPGLRIDDVPQELVRRFTFDPCFTPHKSAGLPEKPLQGEKLFAAWQTQGAEWGWGTKQAEVFLRRCQRKREFIEIARSLRREFQRGRHFFNHSSQSLRNHFQAKKSQAVQPRQKETNEKDQSRSR